jgi:CelD/BcsL family acetyltransferase involved in cellulose biosynthesis
LVVAFAMEGGTTVGACAFESVQAELRFLGGFDVTDYMGPVALPGHEPAVAEALMRTVLDAPWDRADLRGLPHDTPWIACLEQAAASHGLGLQRERDGVAPRIELDGSFDAYLASLPSKLRHELRRKERRLAEATGRHRIRMSTSLSLPEDLDRFMQLHRSSPGPKGRFMQPGMELFFRRLGEAFLPSHQFHLALLEVDGEQAAGAIGLARGDTFSLYNSAFDRAFAELAPGMVLVADLIRDAAWLGRRRFDMLKGDLDYKYRFGAAPREIGRLVLTR